ncbi:MAG: hypothetical protein AMXMBFR33_65520 [Candidatus Xenobia bacterium]
MKPKLETLVVEIRYDQGWLYWDRCGAIWRELQKQCEDLEMVEITTSEAKFLSKEIPGQVNFNYQRAYVQLDLAGVHQPKLDVFDDFLPVITTTLDLDAVTRVGCRGIWIAMGPLENALAVFRRTSLVASDPVSTDPDLEVKAITTSFHAEDDKIGSRITLKSFTRTLTISAPPGVAIRDDFSGTGLSIDIDRFIPHSIRVEQLKFSDFAKACLKRAKHVLSERLGCEA